jgi:hypothetical protein
MIDLNTFIYHEWDSLVPKTDQLLKNENLSSVIPTVDIVRYSFLMTAILIHKKPVLLTGMKFFQVTEHFLVMGFLQVIVVLEKLCWWNQCFDR